MNYKLTKSISIGIFTFLYFFVSIISTIHVVEFFQLSNQLYMSWMLSMAFEIGAAASLASIIFLKDLNKTVVWGLFLILTAFQAAGNTYYSFLHAHDFNAWMQLFGLGEEDVIFQKRVLAIVSGAILPIIALGYIHVTTKILDPVSEDNKIVDKQKKPTKINEEIKIENSKQVEYISDEEGNFKLKKEDTKSLKEVIPVKHEIKIDGASTIDGIITATTANYKIESVNGSIDGSEYYKLLAILFDKGKYKKGDQVPPFTQFKSMIISNHIDVDDKIIKDFLTICNLFKVIKFEKDNIDSTFKGVFDKDFEESSEIILKI